MLNRRGSIPRVAPRPEHVVHAGQSGPVPAPGDRRDDVELRAELLGVCGDGGGGGVQHRDVAPARGRETEFASTPIIAHLAQRGAVDVLERDAVEEARGHAPGVNRLEKRSGGSIVGMEHGARGLQRVFQARRGAGHLLGARGGFLNGEPARGEDEDEGERERFRDRAPGAEQALVQRVRPETRGCGRAMAAAEEVAEVRGRGRRAGGIVATHLAIHRRTIRRPRRLPHQHRHLSLTGDHPQARRGSGCC